MGDCKLCGEKAGFLRRAHSECDSIREAGLQEMTDMAVRAVLARGAKEAQMPSDLLEIARRSYVGPDSIDGVIAEAWHRAVGDSFSDGILTIEEEARLLEFRNRFAIAGDKVDTSLAALEKGARDRVMLNARRLALTPSDTYYHPDELQSSVRALRLPPDEARQLLIDAWVAAVEGSMEDGILTQAEENALFRYMAYFNFSRDEVEDAHRDLVRAVVIRDLSGLDGRRNYLPPERNRPSIQPAKERETGLGVQGNTIHRDKNETRKARYFAWPQHPDSQRTLLPPVHLQEPGPRMG